MDYYYKSRHKDEENVSTIIKTDKIVDTNQNGTFSGVIVKLSKGNAYFKVGQHNDSWFTMMFKLMTEEELEVEGITPEDYEYKFTVVYDTYDDFTIGHKTQIIHMVCVETQIKDELEKIINKDKRYGININFVFKGHILPIN